MNEPEPRDKLPRWAVVVLTVIGGLFGIVAFVAVATILLTLVAAGLLAYTCSTH